MFFLPCHRRDQCRIIAVLAFYSIEKAFVIIEEMTCREQCIAHILRTCHTDLAPDVVQLPITFIRRHEINAQSRNDYSVRSIFFPVEKEGIEVVPTKIHHWENHINQTLFHPSLYVLANPVVCVPSIRTISGKVRKLADGSTTNLYPSFKFLTLCVDILHYACDVVASSCFVANLFPRFRVAYIVKVNTINVIFTDYFFTDVSKGVNCRF